MNVLEKVISAIIAVLIMFIVTASYFQIQKDSVVQVNVELATARLAERASIQGYITREMYEDYIKQLGTTSKLYTIELVHQMAAFEPEYKFRTPGEVTAEDESSWLGTNELHQGTVSTTIPEITDPVSPLPLNTETNASVLAAAHDTPASLSHIHTDACYNGTKHTHTGSSTEGGGCYGQYVQGSTCGAGIVNHVGYDQTQTGTIWCPSCNKFTCTFTVIYDGYRCSAGHYKAYAVQAHWLCFSCGYNDDRFFGNPSYCTYSNNGYYELNCGKTEGHYYNGSTEVFPICSQQVSGIVPTHSLQTVAVGDPLITTVVVTHADGSTITKACTTTFSTTVPGLNRAATLTYTYTIDGVTYTKNCSIAVNVVPRSKVCVKGHTYNLNNDGTDPGCPFCRGWLSSLIIYSPSSGLLRMYHNGGGLIVQGVALLATYMDGHYEYVYNGYTDNLDADYVGTQTVTIGYRGMTTSLQVEVLRKRKLCDVCGLYYDLLPDDTDGGCPYCKAKVPVFTGNIMRYTTATYKEEIITEFYEGSGTYYFQKGDTFTVKAKSRNRADFPSLFGNLFSLKIGAESSFKVNDEIKP